MTGQHAVYFAGGSAGVGHRYWRVGNFQSNSTSVRLREMQLREVAGAPQVFSGTASVVGSSYGSVSLPILFSSSNDYFPIDAKPSAHIIFDFGTPVHIEEVVARQDSSRTPDGWDVSYSDDGSSWTLLSSARGLGLSATNAWTGSKTETGYPRGYPSFPTSTVKTTINDWDFVYTNWIHLRPEDSGWVFRVGLDLSKTFSRGASHIGVIGDAIWTGQGAHCGPVIRRGEQLWSTARGWLIWNDRQFQAENWLDVPPYLTLGAKQAVNQGRPFPSNDRVSVTLAGKYGLAGGIYEDTIAVAVYDSMSLGGGNLIYLAGAPRTYVTLNPSTCVSGCSS